MKLLVATNIVCAVKVSKWVSVNNSCLLVKCYSLKSCLTFERIYNNGWFVIPPYLLLKALQAISDGEIANSPRDVFANVLRFLNENVSNVDLSSTKPEIATKDHDSYERPTFAVPTALEYEFFEGICGINEAALRFSTREYLAYLNMLEQ